MARFESPAEPVGGRMLDVLVRRVDAARGRVRARAPDGEDLVIDLPRGSAIRNGDTFGPSPKGMFYRISIEPEQVLEIILGNGEFSTGEAVKLGYILGNHHLEVLVEKDSLYLPLTLGGEKLSRIVSRSGVPVRTRLVTRVISPGEQGYFEGEEEEGS
ncbi:MAG TPA: hypothetical protein VMT31_06410 [Methanomicrobiales archaeon]|nr:hypothetical protein [Methanomicrobiales archaeon]